MLLKVRKNSRSAPKVCGVYSGLRPELHTDVVEICSVVFVKSCWQTNRPTNIRAQVKTWPPWWSSWTQWSKRTIFKNNLLVFMYKGKKKWSRKPNMSRKGKCTREYLYTALRMFAAPALEIKLNSESGNRQYLYNYTQEGGRERWHTWPTDRPLLANREENQKTSAIFISVGNCLVCHQH